MCSSARSTTLTATNRKEETVLTQPSAEVRAAAAVARALTNAALAQRLTIVRDSPRSASKLDRDAWLDEAVKRLFWPDEYEKHNDHK